MRHDQSSRREFILAAAATGLAAQAFARQPAGAKGDAPVASPGDSHRGPCCISSANGLRATRRAMDMLRDGYDPADCIVQGVRIMEDDPEDDTVGYGGEPNEEGIVELDASVMYGPTHKSGAVAGLRNIKNPAMVALAVLRYTNHCLIVGDGALKFAKRMGFQEENLLTEKARLAWLKWRSELSPKDDWLNGDQEDPIGGKRWIEPGQEKLRADAAARPVHHHTGTVHCSIVTPKGDIASCTSTSGLSWKLPGRVGDSPIIGAGNYCDNQIGAAGCTGRGEAAIVNCAAFDIVQKMGQGMTPTQAALAVARRVAEHGVLEKRHKNAAGRPDFNVRFYAIRKDGAYGSAAIYQGAEFAICDEKGERIEKCAWVYDGKP